MEDIGKLASFFGLIFLLLALVFNIVSNLPRIPGDIYIDKQGIRVHIPFVSAILVAVVLTIIFNFFKQ